MFFKIKEESYNLSKFKRCLKYFFHTHYFYSTEEYFQYRAGTSYLLTKLVTYSDIYFSMSFRCNIMICQVDFELVLGGKFCYSELIQLYQLYFIVLYGIYFIY
jgi:hypothetical protein